MTRTLVVLTLMFAFGLLPVVCAADQPCETQTKPLMTPRSSWSAIYNASIDVPSDCLNGYFGEGISDTLVRKMGHDWPGFLAVMNRHHEHKKFIDLVLKSINATLNPEDIVVVYKLARTSCQAVRQHECDAIAAQSKAALADYDPPRAVP